ncbi:MAG TPA: ABC transporter ATP-binding protein [Rectinemataceae bacterium]|nr:ABC transporter ATP-binding protein [Rectinemataceae bacterium]
MNEPLIRCTELGKTYSGAEELVVLDGLDFEVERGKSVAIMGASGSGKSTLLSILGGLDRASKGRVAVGEWELSSLPERSLADYRASVVGFVFQFHYLLKDFTALENVALPAYIKGTPKKEAFDRAESLLRDMGLAERFAHFPSQLSGGERQRAAIARALINDPSVVLADEPTGNLDSSSARSIRKILFSLCQLYGSTLVLVTHDQQLAGEADLRYELAEGRLRPS